MPHLSHRDFEVLLGAIHEISAHTELTTIPRKMIDLLGEVVECEVAAYNQMHSVTRDIVAVHNYHDPAFVGKLFPILMAHSHEHPAFENHLRTGSLVVSKLTDFLSQTKFEKTGIYNEFFRQVGLKRQMNVFLPRDSDYVISLTLQRSKTDFSERDRLMLELFKPHLAQAHQNARSFEALKTQQTLLRTGLDSTNHRLIAMDRNSKIQWMTEGCLSWLAEYFEGFPVSGNKLPLPVAAWLKSSGDVLRGEAKIYKREGPNGVLEIRAVPRDADAILLLLREVERHKSKGIALLLGLTPRETEVLHWLAEGKSSSGIGIILGISPRTVDKHLERIYPKLGVENRQSAIIRVLEVKNAS
jgi:DNA-binding CsgD family transcriptional regulator